METLVNIEGEGTAWYASGNRYVGQWKNGKSHGEGTYFYASGARCVWVCLGKTSAPSNTTGEIGNWYKVFGSPLCLKYNSNLLMMLVFLRYEGQFDGGKCHGKGAYFYANGNRCGVLLIPMPYCLCCILIRIQFLKIWLSTVMVTVVVIACTCGDGLWISPFIVFKLLLCSVYFFWSRCVWCIGLIR